MSKVGKSLLLDSSIIIAGFKRDEEVLNTALSLQHNLKLYARDQHFEEIEKLDLLK